jgi:hypothetical protein
MSTSSLGVFEGLKLYIDALLGLADATITGTTLNTADSTLDTAATAVNSTSLDAVLTDQSNVANIVNREKAILDARLNKVDQAKKNRDRLIAHSVSYKRRYEAYTKIVTTLVVSIFICAAMMFVQKLAPLPGVSDFVTVGITLVVAYDIIYVITALLSISARDHNNFDRVDPEAVGLATDSELAALKVKATVATTSLCVGDACCLDSTKATTGVMWSSSAKACVPYTATA